MFDQLSPQTKGAAGSPLVVPKIPSERSLKIDALLDSMKIGDSFTVGSRLDYLDHLRRAKRRGWNLEARSATEYGIKLWRVSRTE